MPQKQYVTKVNKVRLTITLTILFLIVMGLVVLVASFFGDDGPSDAQPGDLGSYNFPFESAQEEAQYEAEATTVDSGEDVANAYPASLGAKLHFRAYLPAGATSRENSFVFTKDGYIYYPAIIVPADVRGLTSITEQFEGDGADPVQAYFTLNPVMLGFSENDAPDDTTRYIDVLGTYYWSNARLDENKLDEVPNLPAVLVGSFEEVRKSQVTDPATATVPVDFTFRRGSLTVDIDRVEFTPSATRVHVNTTNDTTSDISWTYSVPQTFLSADDRQYRLMQQDDITEPDPDRLSEQIPAKQSDGYMFFDRTGVPEKLEIYLVDPTDNGTIRHTVDMRRLVNIENEASSLSN